jgi:hypothetical protein
MYIKTRSKNIPAPSRDAVLVLLDDLVAKGKDLNDLDDLVEIVVIAYQNGRYDEASAETQAAAFE